MSVDLDIVGALTLTITLYLNRNITCQQMFDFLPEILYFFYMVMRKCVDFSFYRYLDHYDYYFQHEYMICYCCTSYAIILWLKKCKIEHIAYGLNDLSSL